LLCRSASNLVTEVIVGDSNSTDGTPDLARKMGAQVIQEPPEDTGALVDRACDTKNPDVVVFLDGDYSDRPSELPIILAPIIEGALTLRSVRASAARATPCATVAPIIRQSPRAVLISFCTA